MCERLLRQSVCHNSQSPPQKLCVDDESLDSLVLVRTGAAINEGASQPRRPVRTNQVNQVIRHPRTTFEVVIVNVNKRSVSADSRAFILIYRTNWLTLFLFAAPRSIYCLLSSLLRFRVKCSNYLS